jgi:predicted transglutaminase-like cysteine proteinase
MEFKAYTPAPPEVENLYRNFPALDSRRAAPATVGPEFWETAATVNTKVNGMIRYTPTRSWSGPVERTENSGLTGKPVTTLQGNCRDYVITKMLELLHQGVPLGAMQVADVYLDQPQQGEDPHHLVLLVRRAEGPPWILDNRVNEVHDWPGLPTYRWNRASIPGQEDWGDFAPGQIVRPTSLGDLIGPSGVPGDGA